MWVLEPIEGGSPAWTPFDKPPACIIAGCVVEMCMGSTMFASGGGAKTDTLPMLAHGLSPLWSAQWSSRSEAPRGVDSGGWRTIHNCRAGFVNSGDVGDERPKDHRGRRGRSQPGWSVAHPEKAFAQS